ncbi:hypothetical protein HNY73_000095 [Argiope bruennichi]|uniref:Uncharacterized protein n=1 Tax=Argiope bruennichi TaxID=94029 RepID=A0A8T0G0W1_ARGBR|nr:hypothetical protein HNY73_000095 [Argiope bruennichi]
MHAEPLKPIVLDDGNDIEMCEIHVQTTCFYTYDGWNKKISNPDTFPRNSSQHRPHLEPLQFNGWRSNSSRG